MTATRHTQPTLEAFAHELVQARDERRAIVPASARFASFTLADGYRVGAEVLRRAVGRGRHPTGLKVGFTNTEVWDDLGIAGPMWAPVYRETIDSRAEFACSEMIAPRLEPEIAFVVEREAIVAFALAFEIVDAHYPRWEFTPADAVADGGLHGRLVLGAPVPCDAEGATGLGTREVTLVRNGLDALRGSTAHVLGSPFAVWEWVRANFTPSPELDWETITVVTTGSLTAAPHLHPGERWSFRVEGVDAVSPLLDVR